MKLLGLCKRALLPLALIMAFVNLPKALFGRPVASGNPSEPNEQLQSLLKAPLPGHTVTAEEPSLYKPESLYQYIDGAADVYLLYDFQALLHQNLKNAAAELTADIYQMRTPEDAFGIYAAERSSSYKFVTIGIEGYRSQGILNFVQDRYYVKLTGSGAHTDLALDQLANEISQRIGGVRMLPTLLRKLPQTGLLPRSLQYVRKDPLGHSFLAPAYVAAYGSVKQRSKLFVSVATDAAAAKLRIDQLAMNFKQTGESAAAPELGPNGIRAKNSFEGPLIARTQGRYLILLVNPLSNGPEILKAVAQNLR